MFELLKSPFVFRLTYLCDLLFGGKFQDLAAAAGLPAAQAKRLQSAGALSNPDALGKFVSAGLVNAEWLLCGTGPILPSEPPSLCDNRLTLPTQFTSSFPVFSSLCVAALRGEPGPAEKLLEPAAADVDNFVPVARRIHACRVAQKPVLLALGHQAIYFGLGQVVAEMLRKGYLTGLLFTGAAAAADLEMALFGGRAVTPEPLYEFGALHEAAKLAAVYGMGYGEALSRWAYPPTSNRQHSALSVAGELRLPATVHVAIGETTAHFLPAKHAAEVGAAIGAASYTDMLILTQQLPLFVGEPAGLLLDADPSGACRQVFQNAALVALHNTKPHFSEFCVRGMGGEHRRSFPALLAACDAVYAGTANNGRRTKVRSGKKPG